MLHNLILSMRNTNSLHRIGIFLDPTKPQALRRRQAPRQGPFSRWFRSNHLWHPMTFFVHQNDHKQLPEALSSWINFGPVQAAGVELSNDSAGWILSRKVLWLMQKSYIELKALRRRKSVGFTPSKSFHSFYCHPVGVIENYRLLDRDICSWRNSTGFLWTDPCRFTESKKGSNSNQEGIVFFV